MAILQSAAGYGAGLEATPLARPGYYNNIIARVHEKDFLPEITNSEINERIVRCNQTVQIMRAPEVGEWRNYQKNQQLVPNQISFDATCLQICNAAYNAIKFDQTDIYFACERWAMFEEKFLEEVYKKYVAMQRRWVLTAMILEADPRNKGSAAGKHGNIDLGSQSNPVVVDKDNFPLRLAQIAQVLREQLMWVPGEMFIILPTDFYSVLMQSNFANAAWTGACKPCSIAIDGMWGIQLGGFNIIESVNVPYVIADDGTISYYIIAGHRSAFAYASDIIEGRLVYPTDSFSVQYQMLAVWGGKMIYPEAIAVGLWTFKTT